MAAIDGAGHGTGQSDAPTAPSGASPMDGGVSPEHLIGGRFRLDGVLDDRAGQTWQGRDLLTGTRVAIRAVSATTLPSDASLRLEREAIVLADADMPDLAPLLTTAHEDDVVYLVTSLIPGSPLDVRLRRGPLAPREALRVAISALRGLAHLHAQGLLHGDVKPQNIVVDGVDGIERATLLDFGVGRHRAWSPAGPDEPAGAARYVSPEQAGLLEYPMDERSDVYSTGVVVFECLMGLPPFDADKVGAVLRQHLSAPLPSLRSLGVVIPAAADEFVQRLLRKDPRDRYQSAQGALIDAEQIADAIDRGVSEPAVVVGLHERRRTLTQPGWVGRAEELAALEGPLQAAGDGHGGLVLLEGDSGSGKTRLLDELARRWGMHGMWVLRGQGVDQAVHAPLQLVSGVASDLVEAIGSDPGWATQLRAQLDSQAEAVCHALPQLASVLEVDASAALGPEDFGEERTLEALTTLLEALGSPERPVLVVLDDCQWSDELTVKLLQRWWHGGRRPAHHLAVVAAFRSEEVSDSHPLRGLVPAGHVRLEPLAPSDVSLFVQSMAGPVPDKTIETVQQLSGGNAFMVSAVLRGLVESGALVDTPDGWRFDPRATSEVQSSQAAAAFLTRRLELLPEATLRLLSAGAVLGKTFGVGLAADLVEQQPQQALDNLAEARRRHIVWAEFDPDRCSFVHDKLRETLLGRLSDEHRRRLHRLAAHRLEQLDPSRVFELAYHFDAAGHPDRALPFALGAAAQARGQHALEAAEQQYRIAMRGSSDTDPAVRRRVVQELGEVLMLRGHYDESAERLAEAGLLVSDDVARARLEAQLGELAFKRGDVVQAADALERGLRLLGQRVPHRKVALLAWLGWEVGVQAMHTALPRLALARRSLESADTALLVVHLYSRLTYAYWFGRGKIATGWAHLRELNLAERYPQSPAVAQAYSVHAPVMTIVPLFGRAIAYAQRSLAIRRAASDPWGEGQSLNFYGVALYAASRYREALACCREAARLLEQTGDRWEVNTATWHVAYCLYRLGDLRDAVMAAQVVHVAGIEIGDAQAAGIGLSVWAKASGGRVPQELVDRELARGDDDGHTAAEVRQAQAIGLLREGRADEAVAVLDQARQLIEAKGLRQEYVAPVWPWLATAKRHQAVAVPAIAPRQRAQRLRAARRAARQARRLARSYRNNLPHALRESALVAALGGRPSRAARWFHQSLREAEHQAAAWERAQTLLARGRVGLQLGWPGARDDIAAAASLTSTDLAASVDDSVTLGTTRQAEHYDERVTLSLADRFDAVLETGRRITAALTPNEVYAAVDQAARTLLRAEHCSVVKVDDTTGDVLTVISSQDGDALDSACRQLVQQVVGTNELVTVNRDVWSDGINQLTPPTQHRSALCAPILVRDELVGAFCVTHDQVSGLFGHDEQRLAEFIATLAGAALEHAEGFAEVQALTETLEHRVAERTAQLDAVNRELTHQAFHDSLTGLANRDLFRDRLEHAIALRERAAAPLAMLLVDLDDFKHVNDTLGHAAGDGLLVAVAQRLQQSVRPGDTVARLGGDEFGVLLADPEPTAATAIAERIIATVTAPVHLADRHVSVHASIGIATDDGSRGHAEDLLRHADAAMYTAKRQGKDRIAVFAPDQATVVTREELHDELEEIVTHRRKRAFDVHYQPIIDLTSGRLAGVEALARWDRAEGGPVDPDEFIPVAEQSGLIVTIGRWVLERACHQAATWQDAHPGDQALRLHVNLSPRQLQDGDLADHVADLLADTGLAPGSLALEITERGLVHNPDTVARQLHALSDIGVHLAIDDFGTGHSSLDYLRRFPIDILKIDKVFVSDIGDRSGPTSLTGAIVDLAHTLDLTVVAEGVERPHHATALRTMGCHLGQGYLWSRAQPAHALEQWMETHSP